ncbi:MFS transporter [bacterium]|nr:MFS transporter [bacterium]
MKILNSKKKTISFLLFDWATSPIPTIHTTFIFSIYFVNLIAQKSGSFYWGLIIGIAGFVTAFIGPILGSYSDKKGNRKKILFYLVLIGFFSTGLLWFAKPSEKYFLYATVLSFLSILSMELVFISYNSLLKKVSKKRDYGKISGLSWCAGYLGGIFSLMICLFLFIFPSELPFNIEKNQGVEVRISMVFISLWLIIFSTPIFLYLKEPKKNIDEQNTLKYLKEGFDTIVKNKNLLRYFVARVFYFDALVTIFAFGGIYASKVYGFSQSEILYFAILINIAAAIGACFGGYVDDKFSPFRTIRLSILGIVFSGIFLVLIENKNLFWLTSFCLGFFIGPLQSSSRVLIAKIIPEQRGGQFFGFAIFSGKITSFIGPIVYGIIATSLDSQKFAMLFIIFLLVMSYIILGNNEPNKI